MTLGYYNPSLLFVGKAKSQPLKRNLIRSSTLELLQISYYGDNLLSYHTINDGAKTLSITTFIITTPSIRGLFATFSIMTLSITALCHYAECHYAECHILFIFMLNDIMLNVIMLNVITLSVVAPK